MLLAFHKPYGVLSQFTEKVPGQRTLKDFHFPKRVYPIGRLDMDSEGLLLLSDEPRWTDLLLNPKREHPRTYHVQVEGIADEGFITRLSRGVLIQGWKTKPCKARPLTDPGYAPRNPPVRFRKLIPTSWIEIILTEGKNRQVRRMTAAAGRPTLRLIRTAIGGFLLGNLEPGKWKELKGSELSAVTLK